MSNKSFCRVNKLFVKIYKLDRIKKLIDNKSPNTQKRKIFCWEG